MSIYKQIAIIASFPIILLSCSKNIEWVSTTENQSWIKETGLEFMSTSSSADVTIDTTVKFQTIEGFGACFNELGWTSLSKLKPDDRETIFEELFKPGFGASFNICRMPIGANDFSRDWYSYNETVDDFGMNNFSLENDKQTLIPFIKEALKINPQLRLWASPWSPPSWMKWNNHYACRIPSKSWDPKVDNNLSSDKQGKEGTNMFIQEEKYFKAYSLYFSKFIDSYKKEGIYISMIMPQNEFNSCQIFPSCTWTAVSLATFIGKYLGPSMAKQNIEILFGTMERPNQALVDTIINDPIAGQFIKGVGFQWAGKDALPGIHMRYHNLKLYQTEQECGDGKNDWKHCQHAWDLMKHYFNNGVSAYMYWNISLIEGGYSRWGWQQNSLITVDSLKSTYHLNHEYYLMKHLSHFVKSGARRIKTDGHFNNLLAFQNPDKSIVLVIESNEEQEITIKIGSNFIKPRLQKGSFNTIKLK
jgi:glucosylceramidase